MYDYRNNTLYYNSMKIQIVSRKKFVLQTKKNFYYQHNYKVASQ